MPGCQSSGKPQEGLRFLKGRHGRDPAPWPTCGIDQIVANVAFQTNI
jgi:hypothetical protein